MHPKIKKEKWNVVQQLKHKRNKKKNRMRRAAFGCKKQKHSPSTQCMYNKVCINIYIYKIVHTLEHAPDYFVGDWS